MDFVLSFLNDPKATIPSYCMNVITEFTGKNCKDIRKPRFSAKMRGIKQLIIFSFEGMEMKTKEKWKAREKNILFSDVLWKITHAYLMIKTFIRKEML